PRSTRWPGPAVTAATAAAGLPAAARAATPAAGLPAAARAARAAGIPIRGRPTAPAASPTSRRSRTHFRTTPSPPQAGLCLKEHHDGQATTAQAQEKGLRVLPGADRLRRLQGHRPAPQVHLGPREDPRPPGDG